MSFLRKFLGISEPPPREKIPRAPRIPLKKIHHLILTSPRWDGQIIQVVNISTTGLGVEDINRPEDISIESIFPAMLTLNQKTFPVLLRVAQVAQDVVGLAFQGDVHQLQRAIFDYFVAEISGMEVNRVNSKLLKPDSRGEPHWFFASNNSELYYTSNKEKVTYFHMTLLGNYIECYRDNFPKFGYVVTQEGQNKLKADSSALIRFTEEMPETTIDLFIKFLLHVHDLTPEVKKFILSTLEELKADQHGKIIRV